MSPQRNHVSSPHRITSTLVAALLAPLVWLTAPGDSVASDSEFPTWDLSLDELRARGMGQYRGDPIPIPENLPRLRDPKVPPRAKMGVVFVNFDGAELRSGQEDSRSNSTSMQFMVGTFAPYGEGAKREAVLQAVRDDFAAYNIIVTDQRPASGDYTMNMTGPTNPLGGGILGVAPLDCNDAFTHNNITYAFHSANDQFSAALTATTIGQEVAHSYGLEHVDNPGDIMNPYNAGGDPVFNDSCIQIVSDQGIVCGAQHAQNCGSQSMQNAHQELLALFGPSAPDTSAPVLSVRTPEDGAAFAVGFEFYVVVDAMDDNAVSSVELYQDGVSVGQATGPYSWSFQGLSEGSYEFYAEGLDLAGNSAITETITVHVGEPPSADGESGGADEDSGGGSGSGDGPGDDGRTAGDAATTGPAADGQDSDDGCGCRQTSEPRAGWLFVVGLGVLARRRRQRSGTGWRTRTRRGTVAVSGKRS